MYAKIYFCMFSLNIAVKVTEYHLYDYVNGKRLPYCICTFSPTQAYKQKVNFYPPISDFGK